MESGNINSILTISNYDPTNYNYFVYSNIGYEKPNYYFSGLTGTYNN
jgi:hypothetical protein